MQKTPGYKIISHWLQKHDRKPFAFQEQTWAQISKKQSGLVNAPTGYGKTYSVFLGALIQFINDHPSDYKTRAGSGLQLLWITPLRALAKDIGRAMEEVIRDLGMQWQVGIRNGDTPVNERAKQKRKMPEVFIITPESLHLFLAQKDYPHIFRSLKIIAVDEWHELLGSKRGVQVELALSRIVHLQEALYTLQTSIWGISATIGNLDEARDVLLSTLASPTGGISPGEIISAHFNKKIEVESVFPDEIEKYPWAGHLGIQLAEKALPVIHDNRTTLIFINTRGMSEQWYVPPVLTSVLISDPLKLLYRLVHRKE
jgi:ATP-dependent Lhr-like helicase